jgi:hypothetical protein
LLHHGLRLGCKLYMGCDRPSVHAVAKVQIAGVNRRVFPLSSIEPEENDMKIAWPGITAALLLAATGWQQPAQAQRAPQGSYLGSCSGVVARGDNLAATCRRRDGGEQRSELSGFRRCTGDIGNDNGVLHCNFAGGPVWGVVVGRAGPPPAAVVPPPAYVPAPAYVPPVYSAPPAGWERARWERCRHLHERVEELRARREHTYDPRERERISYRLGQARAELERCR